MGLNLRVHICVHMFLHMLFHSHVCMKSDIYRAFEPNKNKIEVPSFCECSNLNTFKNKFPPSKYP